VTNKQLIEKLKQFDEDLEVKVICKESCCDEHIKEVEAEEYWYASLHKSKTIIIIRYE